MEDDELDNEEIDQEEAPSPDEAEFADSEEPSDEELYRHVKNGPQVAKPPPQAQVAAPANAKSDDDELYQHLLKSKFDPKSDEYKQRMNERNEEAESKQNESRLKGIFGSLANNRSGLTMYGKPIGPQEGHAGDELLKQSGALSKQASELRSPDRKGEDQALYQYLRDRTNDKYRSDQLDAMKDQHAATNELDSKKLAASIQAKKDALAAKANQEKSPSKITAATASQVGGYDAALKVVDKLDKGYDKLASAKGSGIKSYIPGTDSNLYEKDRDVAAQTIGTILEGGKLSDRDYPRYRKMLPGPEDTNSQKKEKVDALKQLIAIKRNGEVGGLGDAGYDVSGYSNADTAVAAPERKMINGVMYEKVNGGWKKVK